jgi:hypothetical protein
MKKISAVLLTLALLFTLCACGSSEKNRTLTCDACDKENSADASFCSGCGASLEEARQKADEAAKEDEDSFDADEYENVDCFECYDAGYDTCQGHECYACEGEGGSVCAGCGGDGDVGGVMTCLGCNGSGKFRCSLCKGAGTIYHAYTTLPDSVTPSGPYERETTECTECDKGKVTCELCEGTGRFGTGSTPSYTGGQGGTYDKLCTSCRGAKTHKCYTCGGDGICGN